MTNINLFSQILQQLPKSGFRSLVDKHKSEKYIKGINSWTHLVCMLFCHFGQANSVRDIVGGMKSVTGNLNHLGVERVPCKSSLSYMNKQRNCELFKDYYFKVLDHIEQKFSPMRKELAKLRRKLYILDATILPLCLNMFEWARYRSAKGAAKIHLVLDYDGCLPVFANITDGKTHEVNIARTLEFPEGSILTFDRAFIDYKWLNVLDSNDHYFVTRAKTNMAFEVLKQHIDPDKPQQNILADNDIRLTGKDAKDDYPKKLRYIRYLDSKTGKEYIFLTNNHQWKAQTVADIYKQRWQIEVFFKHLKQQLCIKSFIGTSQNAVTIQVWTALITILLLKYLQKMATYNWNLSNLVSFIRLNLFVKTDLWEWIHSPFYDAKDPPPDPQLKLSLTPMGD
jgi:hypothetical protein